VTFSSSAFFLSLPSILLFFFSFLTGSYFSENSLLPGLVKGAFVEDSAAKHYLASLADEMEARPNGMPQSWLLAQMRQLGLDTYTHNFTLHYPLADKVVSFDLKCCKNCSRFSEGWLCLGHIFALFKNISGRLRLLIVKNLKEKKGVI